MMADDAELHQEARELPVRQHDELISQQFALACHLPQHDPNGSCLFAAGLPTDIVGS